MFDCKNHDSLSSQQASLNQDLVNLVLDKPQGAGEETIAN